MSIARVRPLTWVAIAAAVVGGSLVGGCQSTADDAAAPMDVTSPTATPRPNASPPPGLGNGG
jgi:hypothetical protein